MISLKSNDDIEVMATGGRILRKILNELQEKITPGLTGQDIEGIANKLFKKYKVKPAFLGFRNYPYSICLSIDGEVVHGLPLPSKKIREGDLVSLDLGVEYRGFCTDAAVTFGVGEISEQGKTLIQATQQALRKAIGVARVGNTLADIGRAIETTAKKYGFNVVEGFTGHGIGRNLQEEPPVHNLSTKEGQKIILKPGMVLAIEPMLSAGSGKVIIADDGWTVKTSEGTLACHFEETVAITKDGPNTLILPQN